MPDILEYRPFVQAHCANEISNRPYPSSPPVSLSYKFEFLMQRSPRVLFDDLDHLRNAVLGWKTDHNVDMVRLDISFQILDFRVPLADLVHFYQSMPENPRLSSLGMNGIPER